MRKTQMPKPLGYFACNPETLEPAWDEGCVCESNIYNKGDTGTVGRAFIFVDQAEAYAAARVREALEEAEFQIGLLYIKRVAVCEEDILSEIRALIPSTIEADTVS